MTEIVKEKKAWPIKEDLFLVPIIETIGILHAFFSWEEVNEETFQRESEKQDRETMVEKTHEEVVKILNQNIEDKNYTTDIKNIVRAYQHDINNALNGVKALCILIRWKEQMKLTKLIEIVGVKKGIKNIEEYTQRLWFKKEEFELKQHYLEKIENDKNITVQKALKMINEHCKVNANFTHETCSANGESAYTLKINEIWFHILIQEILTNSIKHGINGKLTTNLSKETLSITVSDQKKLIDTKISWGEWTGIIKNIIEKMWGEINTAEEENNNTFTTYITIPLHAPEETKDLQILDAEKN